MNYVTVITELQKAFKSYNYKDLQNALKIAKELNIGVQVKLNAKKSVLSQEALRITTVLIEQSSKEKQQKCSKPSPPSPYIEMVRPRLELENIKKQIKGSGHKFFTYTVSDKLVQFPVNIYWSFIHYCSNRGISLNKDIKYFTISVSDVKKLGFNVKHSHDSHPVFRC